MYVIQVEGNIGVGKSTLIKSLNTKLSNWKNKNIKLLKEPLEYWTNVGGTNILELYYKDKKKYAELFQNFVFMTLLREHLSSNFNNNNCDIIITERCLATGVHCFAKMLLNQKYVSPLFYDILDDCLKKFRDVTLKPDIIVYIKIEDNDIRTLLRERIEKRKRKEEMNNIDINYLLKLNDVYNKYIENISTQYDNKVKVITYPIIRTKEEENQCINQIINKLDKLEEEKEEEEEKINRRCC